LEIDPGQVAAVQFERNAWLRVDTYKKKLKDFPALEIELWKKLNNRLPVYLRWLAVSAVGYI
jgi:hypothetical protein